MSTEIINTVCGDAEPRLVLHFFEELCKIPHGSFHTEKVSDWIASYAEGKGLWHLQDASGNVIIKKDGTGRGKDSAPVILQGHMDMVLEKTDDCPLDLEKDPIVLKRDGDTLYAEGTTLGGDDGIAVAMMLALLEDDTLEHPPLECVFTVNEEVGLLGAAALDVAPLEGRRMINIDSEDEGIFTVGCAGGAEEHCTLPVSRAERTGLVMTITINGLLGGHSGTGINLGRANADILMGRVLYALLEETSAVLISVDGGSKDNAIPRACTATVMIDDAERESAERIAHERMEQILREYYVADPSIAYQISFGNDGEETMAPLTREDTRRIVDFLVLTPNGLFETDPLDKSMPQTSLNLGILTTAADHVTAVYLVRSCVNSQKKMLQEKVERLTGLLGGTTEVKGAYPAWERAQNSPLCDELARIYEQQTGEKPVITTIHGGLECGLLAAKLEGLDCVSIGPDLADIHTPDEKLSIASAHRVWTFLLAVLQEMAAE